MEASRARRAVAGESRPVISPVRMPMMLASLIPAPSCALKTFISATLPSGNPCRQTTRGVIVPSTSISRTRTFLARRIACAGNLISRIGISGKPQLDNDEKYLTRTGRGLEQLERPQVVEVNHPLEAPRVVHHDHGGDLFFFHQSQRRRGKLRFRKRHRLLRHAINRGQIEYILLPPLHHT